jgi:hypothetical protein
MSPKTLVSNVLVIAPPARIAYESAAPSEIFPIAWLESEIRKVAGITRDKATTVNIASFEDLLLRDRA